ncbi:glycoside hydrolase family 3 N-terminal domain-containing protein [Haladaptatus halobius]|uniref:glycoside hydrolase family 3 N-terminal domain-containing protein n=1 Tax=Haladaptatus halobius TaxID=2884875 RepID=UPI001D0B49FE|nr:glycoside hydrolase family 3 N-terminal domain-containing protein [Haladaptatus halobius]
MQTTNTELVTSLLADLSLEEKVAQLGTVRIGSLLENGEFSRERALKTIPHGIGRVTRVGRESHLDPTALARVVRDIQKFLEADTRPGIPAIFREEALCGYAGRRGTAFPQSIGMASTWNLTLVEQVTDEISGQLQAVGCQATLAPVLDIGLDPRWGRIEETYGEDPYLVACMGLAAIEGFQAGSWDSVLATAKHFAGHGRPEGGRNRAPVTGSLRTLKQNDLRPFRAAVERGGVESIMAAYHAVDGVPCHADNRLLTGILREEWGFDGTVVSDGRGIELLCDDHHVVPDHASAGVTALRAGIDVELPERECFGASLVEAVREKRIDKAFVDQAVRRHLEQKSRLGLFDSAVPEPERASKIFDTDKQHRLARNAARESLVLLENDGTLPLADEATVAIVGPNADAPRHLFGNYTYAAAESDEDGLEVITPLAAIRNRLGQEAVRYEQGCSVKAEDDPANFESHEFDATRAAADAVDVVVACVGGRSGIDVEREATGTAGEGLDRTSLGLPGHQHALLEAVAETGTPVVVVLINGRPLSLDSRFDAPSAILEAWLPGQAGGLAIADVLFGDVDASGRLPVSIPRAVGQLPVQYCRTALSADQHYVDEAADPWYPFGHGESYTTFEYSELDLETKTVSMARSINFSLEVENTGKRPGIEVVQLYVRDLEASVTRPVRELRGFSRLSLSPGERRRISFSLPVDALALVDRDAEWMIEPGSFELQIGRSTADIRLRETVEVVGEPTPPSSPIAFSDSTVGR